MRTILEFIIKVLGGLNATLRASLGDALGRLFALIRTRDRSIAQLQLSLCFDTGRAKQIVPLVYSSLGQTLLEAFNLKSLIAAGALEISPQDWELAQKLLKQNKGILTLSAHTGNWELMAAGIVQRGVKLSVIAREAHSDVFQSILRKIRDSYGVETIWRGNRQSVSEIIQKLNNREVVAALIDQDTRVSGEFTPFFGRPAKTPSTIVELAKRNGAIITTSFCVRLARGKYRALIDQIPTELSTSEILTEYNRRLEAVIRQYPEQWPWMHKRWRSQPDGSHPRSGEYLLLLQRLVNERTLNAA